ncbi:AraC family transcriptional regulator [Dasania marina]|uniref:AraC family transcriptional regulator n=1 Tax=Dasania marina TaxID=471499 RepID=UPI0030DC8E91|tara:strand:- start:1820 stop:2803 length:984 start_codon:yes stop_codon:yes gene_type:complete
MTPLNDHTLVNTKHLDYARKLISGVYCDHKLSLANVAHNDPFFAIHNYVPIDDLSINYMTYSSKVIINPGFLDDFYLLQLPLNNSTATVHTCGQEVLSHSEVATVINPSEKTSMVWNEGCQQLMVQIKRSSIEQALGRLSRCNITKPLVFDPLISLSDNRRMDSWWRYIKCMVSDIDEGSFSYLGTAEKKNIEKTIVANLLHALPHNYSSLLEVSQHTIAPKHVKQAEAFMLENLSVPINIVDLVEVCGVSARSLFDAFKRFRGVTPMKRLQKFRLEQAHQCLMAAKSDDTVTDILTQLGVSQLGRFAAIYKSAYGETPSQTVKKSL